MKMPGVISCQSQYYMEQVIWRLVMQINVVDCQLDQTNNILPRNSAAPQTSVVDLLPPSFKRISPSDKRAFAIALSACRFVLNVAHRALEAFASHDLRSFDAHLGNNSCYLSASICVQIAKRFKSDATFMDYVKNAINNIDQLILDFDLVFKNLKMIELSQYKDVSQFLQRQGISMNFSPEIHYLIMAYACSVAKCKNENSIEVIDYEQLFKYFYEKDCENPIPRSSLVKLHKFWQKTLSVHNIEFLQLQASNFRTEDYKWNKYVSDSYIKIDQRGRLCSSSFYAIKVLLDSLALEVESLVSLLINVFSSNRQFLGKFPLFFKPIPGSGKWTLADASEIAKKPDNPVLTVEGCSYNDRHLQQQLVDIKREFSRKDLTEVIFSHEITYPQYPRGFNGLQISPTEPDLIRELARLKQQSQGYSLDAPSELCLVHLYPDTVKRQLAAKLDPPTHLPGHKKNKSCST